MHWPIVTVEICTTCIVIHVCIGIVLYSMTNLESNSASDSVEVVRPELIHLVKVLDKTGQVSENV